MQHGDITTGIKCVWSVITVDKYSILYTVLEGILVSLTKWGTYQGAMGLFDFSVDAVSLLKTSKQ